MRSPPTLNSTGDFGRRPVLFAIVRTASQQLGLADCPAHDAGEGGPSPPRDQSPHLRAGAVSAAAISHRDPHLLAAPRSWPLLNYPPDPAGEDDTMSPTPTDAPAGPSATLHPANISYPI
jgi:hypothetical protein